MYPQSLAGVYGWDSAELAVNHHSYARHRETELIHARWALLGVIDFFTPETMDRHDGVSWQMVCFIAGA